MYVLCSLFALLSCRQFSASDDVFCLFIGNLENLPQLRQMYGLTRHVTEPQMVIEAFKVLRDRGPYTADQVLADYRGVFNVVIYDLNAEKLFLAGVRAFYITPVMCVLCIYKNIRVIVSSSSTYREITCPVKSDFSDSLIVFTTHTHPTKVLACIE